MTDEVVPWLPCEWCGWMPISCACGTSRVLGTARHRPKCRCQQCTSDRRWDEAQRAERARVRARLRFWPAA